MAQAIGLYRLELKQRRFKSGALYISAICVGNILESIDIRYFVEVDNKLIPTRQGFRVYSKELVGLRPAMAKNPDELTETVLWEGPARKLIVRYCDDEYGRAVDFRYFKTTEKYTGWEPRGIRLQVEDYKKLHNALTQSTFFEEWHYGTINLFEGKAIQKAQGRPKGGLNSPVDQQSTSISSLLINEALSAFINDL